MILATCAPAFVVSGVTPSGVATCRLRHESAGLNDERWFDLTYPMYVRCSPGEIAWQSGARTVGCRRRVT